MKSERLVFILVTVALLTLSYRTHSQDAPAEHSLVRALSQEKAVDSLTSTNRDVRVDAAVELVAQRARLVERLLVILGSTNADEVKMAAVVVLAHYRAPEAISFLLQHLDWEITNMHGTFFSHPRREDLEEGLQPVTSALYHIGLPAVPALLDKIAQTDDTRIAQQCVRSCVAIESLEVTQFRLQELLKKATDQNQKDRIRGALNALEKVKEAK